MLIAIIALVPFAALGAIVGAIVGFAVRAREPGLSAQWGSVGAIIGVGGSWFVHFIAGLRIADAVDPLTGFVPMNLIACAALGAAIGGLAAKFDS